MWIERAPAYGLALATYGLSFSIGPVLGSYMAARFGPQSVFLSSLALVLIDLLYIVLILPENSNSNSKGTAGVSPYVCVRRHCCHET